jgi:hypothetical protein
MTLLDLRSQQTLSGPPKAGKLDRHGQLAMRSRGSIDAICLHQTACTFGVSPAAIRKQGGDAALAQFMRAKNVHAHVTAFDEGTFVPAYPLRAYVWHGNGANARSIGLEIEGYFNGQPGGVENGNPDDERTEPTELLLQTARSACTWIVEAAKLEGITIKHVLAHRQYDSSRRSDPGWAIWQHVAIEHCERALGLTPLPTLTDRDGMPIPRAWDERQSAAY